mmetsp:Transcript_23128/g.54685  ORF Transcript_23128/g.54685 Transcript_23128/m.54685 type:complete len:217 (+) Transcript_23128:154-804(+)
MHRIPKSIFRGVFPPSRSRNKSQRGRAATTALFVEFQRLAPLYLGRNLQRRVDALAHFVQAVKVLLAAAALPVDHDRPLERKDGLRDQLDVDSVAFQDVPQDHLAVAPSVLPERFRDGLVALLQVAVDHRRDVRAHDIRLLAANQYPVVVDLRREHLRVPCVAAEHVGVRGRIRRDDLVKVEIVEPEGVVPQNQDVVIGLRLVCGHELGFPQRFER